MVAGKKIIHGEGSSSLVSFDTLLGPQVFDGCLALVGLCSSIIHVLLNDGLYYNHIL